MYQTLNICNLQCFMIELSDTLLISEADAHSCPQLLYQMVANDKFCTIHSKPFIMDSLAA